MPNEDDFDEEGRDIMDSDKKVIFSEISICGTFNNNLLRDILGENLLWFSGDTEAY